MLVSYRGRSAFFDPDTLNFGPPGSEGRAAAWAPPAPARPSPLEAATDRTVLERLVINVANTCNLDCVYCYAQGGDYGTGRRLMQLGVGPRAFRAFASQYARIATVHFFGGEPFLNPRAIREVCDAALRHASEHGVTPPTFTVSTNGTVIGPEVIDLVNGYGLRVTVSCDGPPDVVDALRPRRSGEGIGHLLERNIAALRAATGQPTQIEGTFTAEHLRRGVTVRDVMSYCLEVLGAPVLHMPVNALAEDGPHDRVDPRSIGTADMPRVCDQYAEAAAATVRAAVAPVGSHPVLATAFEMLKDVVFPPLSQMPTICPAGTGTIAVDVDGTVLPCFMFFGREEHRIGHVDDALAGEPPIDTATQVRFVSALDRTRGEAGKSWAHRLFSGCAGANFFARDHHGATSPEEVELVEAMAAAVVVELTELLTHAPDARDYLPLGLQLLSQYVLTPG